jgi:hypothetical protein
VSFLEHLDALGVTDQVTFLLTADHGFEGSDPAVTGSWGPALESLAIPFRDEGPGFIYLLPDPRPPNLGTVPVSTRQT